MEKPLTEMLQKHAELMQAVADAGVDGADTTITTVAGSPTAPSGPQPSSSSFQKASTTRLPKIATPNSKPAGESAIPSPATAAANDAATATTTKLVPINKKNLKSEAPSAFEDNKLTTVGGPTNALSTAAADVAEVEEAEEGPPVNRNGMVTVRFNHYKKQFAIADGVLKAKTIDDEYYITFAFPGARIHLTTYAPSDFGYEDLGLKEPPIVNEKPTGTFQRLEADKVYYVHVEEDSKAKEEYEARQEKLATENAKKRAQKEAAEADGLAVITTAKTESCSCIEGNPCIDAYCCKDWTNRHEVAKKNGWKGFQ